MRAHVSRTRVRGWQAGTNNTAKHLPWPEAGKAPFPSLLPLQTHLVVCRGSLCRTVKDAQGYLRV